MSRLRTALIAAAMFAAAVFVIPVSAQCGEDDPHCAAIPPDPPQSREVALQFSAAAAELASFPASPQLNTLTFTAPMPAPPQADLSGILTSSPEGSAPALATIPVGVRYQTPGDHSCGVQALGMALDGLDGAAPTSAAILGMLQGNGWMYDYGTGVEELALTAAAFGYAAQPIHGWDLQVLAVEVAAGRPVVVALGANGRDQPGHFVTVTGISDDRAWGAYSDPLRGERVIAADAFDALWAAQGRSGLQVSLPPSAPAAGIDLPGLDSAAWMLSLSALLAVAALGLQREGIGGALVATEEGGALPTTFVGLDPPYTAPEGMLWEQGEPLYDTVTKTVVELEQVPHMVQQQVQVGTTTETIPYIKTYQVDEGHWVTDYKYERYVKYYRKQSYVRYYTTRRYPAPWGGYYYQKVPVYGTRYVPVYGTRKVACGRHWEANWVTYETTEYKTIITPVYETQWAHDGTYDQVPVEKEVTDQVLKGYTWTLVKDPALEAEEPLPVEHLLTNGPYDPARWVQATGNLHLRECPAPEAAHLAYISEGERIWYTGRKTEVEGAAWNFVRTVKNGEELAGWVIGGYFERVAAAPESVLRTLEMHTDECITAWYNELSADERNAVRLREWQAVQDYLAALKGLLAALEPATRVVVEEELDVLRQPPDWVREETIPAVVFGRSLLSPEWLAGMKELVQWVEPTNDLWELAAQVYCVSPGDLKLQVLGGATWPVTESTSAGDYPVDMLVVRKYGHMLLAVPSPDAANVSEAFLGVLQGERVIWNGGYHVGVDAEGQPCTYYQVSWTVNNRSYTGWIPAVHLAPQLTARDPFAERIYGDWDNPTFGYGEGAAAWAAFHAGGAAQYLNLQALFRSMGYSEEECAAFATRHTELCGELAVMHALGVSLEEGFARFAALGESFAAILADPGMGTRADQLREFIEAFENLGWSGRSEQMTIREIRDVIVAGDWPIVLIAIDSFGNASEQGNVNHWVHVTQIDEENAQVHFFNPFSNSMQCIGVDEFVLSRSPTGSNLVVVVDKLVA